jgi:hypothetical protein
MAQKRRNPESELQQICVIWFRLQYPKLANRLFAIPNGGHRSKVTAAILKAEGVMAGVSDLFLSVPKNGFGGMWIEMKAPGGRLSDIQQQFISEHKGVYECAVCYNVEQFISAVNNYLNT